MGILSWSDSGNLWCVCLGGEIPGLRVFPTQFGSGLVLPSSSAALWCWLRGDDRGKLLHAGRKIIAAVSSDFALDSVIDGFQFDNGRDLSGLCRWH